MTSTARPFRFLAVAASLAAATVALTAQAGSADAGRLRVRVGGRVHFHAGGHIFIGGGVRRHYVRPYARVGYVSPVYVGVQYAEPPPPPCEYECGAPTYYAEPQVAVVAPEPPEPVPLVGLGVFAGSVDVEHGESGGDLGIFGRLRLTHHFRLEGEISKTEHEDATRVDRRMGAALLYDFSPYATLSPYILAGMGAGRTEMDDGRYGATQGYGELGIGLEWRLAPHFSLMGDIRAGSRDNRPDDDSVALTTSPEPRMQEQENYTRGRVGAILFF